MSVYIKGMEMPKDCALLLKIFPDGRVGVPVHLNWMGTMVVNDAEAVPVPPHGDLVDRTEMREIAISLLDKAVTDQEANAIREMWSHLGQMPVSIPAEEDET